MDDLEKFIMEVLADAERQDLPVGREVVTKALAKVLPIVMKDKISPERVQFLEAHADELNDYIAPRVQAAFARWQNASRA
jgi:hypothetical protein